jgi:hypothetical protein
MRGVPGQPKSRGRLREGDFDIQDIGSQSLTCSPPVVMSGGGSGFLFATRSVRGIDAQSCRKVAIGAGLWK